MADIWYSLPPTVTHVALAFEDAEASDVRGVQVIKRGCEYIRNSF